MAERETVPIVQETLKETVGNDPGRDKQPEYRLGAPGLATHKLIATCQFPNAMVPCHYITV